MSTLSLPKGIDDLPIEVLHEIISYLDHDSRIDLIQTNRNFYQILAHLPMSLRITLDDINRVELDDNKVTLYNEEWEISETLEDWHNVSKFIKVVKSKEYHLNIITEENEQKYCQFMIDNRDIIKFSELIVTFLPDKISHYDLWREVFSITDSFIFREKSTQLLKEQARKQFESLLLEHPTISQCIGIFSRSFFMEYLKQCGKKLRFIRKSAILLIEREAMEQDKMISSLPNVEIIREAQFDEKVVIYFDHSLNLLIMNLKNFYFLHDFKYKLKP